MRVSQEDSVDLGFVIECLVVGAIDKSELRAWCDHAIAALDDVPDYMFDLAYFDEPAFHVYKVIGFAPDASEADPDAIAGIALKRGREIDVEVTQPSEALGALGHHPEVLARFRQTFPFINNV